MPPRLNFPSNWVSTQLCLRPAKPATSCSLPLISIANASSRAKKRATNDPYAQAQAQARKEANLKRRKALEEERNKLLGDPVKGIVTPFVEGFDTAAPIDRVAIPEAPKYDSPAQPEPSYNIPVSSDPPLSGPDSSNLALPGPGGLVPVESSFGELAISETDSPAPPEPVINPFTTTVTATNLNHFLKPKEVDSQLQQSFILTQPLPDPDRPIAEEAELIRAHREQHERAVFAIRRIVNLQNGNSKDRMRVNKQKCIEVFGRHNTDRTIEPRLPSYHPQAFDSAVEPVPRAGPDTGSSEVQIAILTAKIRAMTNTLHSKDQMNKRNLTILVHKRQKLLRYLRRKERGGPRWQNLVEKLGLTEGTWRGEITLA